MDEYEFRTAVIEILHEMLEGIEWPAREHAMYKINALERKVEQDRQHREGTGK